MVLSIVQTAAIKMHKRRKELVLAESEQGADRRESIDRQQQEA